VIGVLLAGKIGSWICGIPLYHHTTGSPSTRFIALLILCPRFPKIRVSKVERTLSQIAQNHPSLFSPIILKKSPVVIVTRNTNSTP